MIERPGRLPRDVELCLTGWHGFTAQRVRLIGFSPKKARIEALTQTRLAGRRRSLEAGKLALVPIAALREIPGGRLI